MKPQNVFRHFMISKGHNNVELMKPLVDIDGDLFQDYYFENYTYEWNSWQSLRFDGNRRNIKVGLPSITITFPVLSYKEFEEWESYCGDGNEDAEVTIKTLDTRQDVWRDFNGIAIIESYDAPRSYYPNVVTRIYDLQEIV